MPRRERERELVAIAYQHIAERGLEGLRFADVARQAGINNATLLYYFPNKEALIQAVVGQLMHEYATIELPRASDIANDPLEELRLEFEDASWRLSQRPDLSLVYGELLVRAHRDPVIAGLLRQVDEGWRGSLRSVLERGRKQGVFRADLDPDAVASTIMTVLKGVSLQAAVEPNPNALSRMLEDLSQLIERWVVLV